MSLCWLSSQTVKAEDNMKIIPLSFSPPHSSDKIITTIFRYKNTFLKSSFSSSRLPYATSPILLVDLQSLRTDTEVGFIVKFPTACVSMSSGSMADVPCVGSRGERGNSARPCASSSIMAIVCYFPRDNTRIKTRRKLKECVGCFSGEMSPLV